MAAYQGTYYTVEFTFEDQDGAPIDISTWTFKAQIRKSLADTVVLLELTTANVGFALIDGPNGRVQMKMLEAQTAALPVGGLVLDVLRTDAIPGPIWLFGAKMKVKEPVTR